MFCHKCGKQLAENSKFCCYCGVEIKYVNQEFAEHKSGNIKSNNIAKTIPIKLLVFIAILLVLVLVSLKLKEKALSHEMAEYDVSSETTSLSNDKFEDTFSQSSDSYETNEERWDAECGVYANFKYGIAFNLSRDVDWEKISGTSKHTIAKFIQPETGLFIVANIIPFSADIEIDDIWDFYDEFVELSKTQVLSYISNNTSKNVTCFEHEKAKISGKHSIKTIFRYTEDICGEVLAFTSIEYRFIHNNCTIGISATCPDECLELYMQKGMSLEYFLYSFQITPENNFNILK